MPSKKNSGARVPYPEARDDARPPLPTLDEQHAQADTDDERRARAAFEAGPGNLPVTYHMHGVTFEVYGRGAVAACAVDMASDEEVYGLRVDVRPPAVRRYATTPRRAYRLDVLAGFKRGAADHARGLHRAAFKAYRYEGNDNADRWHHKRLGYTLAQQVGHADEAGHPVPLAAHLEGAAYGLDFPAIYLETSRKVRPPARRRRGDFLATTRISTASTDHSAGR